MAKILIPEQINASGVELLKAAGHEVITPPTRDVETLTREIRGVDGVLVRVMDITREMMASAPNLKIISKHGVGVDNIDLDAARELGITVTTTPNANSVSVAEHAFSLMMSLAKNIIPISQGYKSVGFSIKNSCEGVEVTGKTVGIVGLGRIGKLFAHMTQGFDMEVLAYDPFVTQPPEGVTMVSDLDELLRRADFVSLHSPLLPETRGMIGQRQFHLMKKTAFLINCARGPVVDEQALIQALQSGQIAGAGLDVTVQEPCDPNSPLFQLPNVILTPHYAPTTAESAKRVSTIAAENLLAYFGGGEVVGRIV